MEKPCFTDEHIEHLIKIAGGLPKRTFVHVRKQRRISETSREVLARKLRMIALNYKGPVSVAKASDELKQLKSLRSSLKRIRNTFSCNSTLIENLEGSHFALSRRKDNPVYNKTYIEFCKLLNKRAQVKYFSKTPVGIHSSFTSSEQKAVLLELLSIVDTVAENAIHHMRPQVKNADHKRNKGDVSFKDLVQDICVIWTELFNRKIARSVSYKLKHEKQSGACGDLNTFIKYLMDCLECPKSKAQIDCQLKWVIRNARSVSKKSK